eukprot:6000331-Pleurochrysis_carterae.AAC.1
MHNSKARLVDNMRRKDFAAWRKSNVGNSARASAEAALVRQSSSDVRCASRTCATLKDDEIRIM